MALPALERLREGNFEDLTGTKLYVRLPLSRAFLNQSIKRSLPDKIKRMQVQSIQGRIMTLQIETTVGVLPVFKITVELYESLTLPRLALRLNIVDGLGWLARSVVDKLLPDGLDINDKVMTIDLYHLLLQDSKYRKIVDKIAFARWVGAQDKLLLEFELQL